jgi:hypothetical protein
MWKLDRFFSEYFCFPLFVSFHRCPILTFMYILLLPERQAGEVRDLPKSNTLLEIEKLSI